jgi:DNA helicase HerA-like ATPase
MLQMMAEIYSTFPEEGDAEQPKLIIFIDEAHLIFKEASKALLDQIESIVKLIRSKGVGLYFVTQNPQDIPDDILGQLGFKIQHALRAFTAKDRKAIKMAAENYPLTDYYDTANLMTQLGIGEAFVTALNEKGRPTPLVQCLLRAPQSRMDVLTQSEIDTIVNNSSLVKKYNKAIDRESAYEILKDKIKRANEEEELDKKRKEEEKANSSKSSGGRRSSKRDKSTIEQVMDSSVGRQVGRTIARELTRGLLGILGIKRR